MTKTSHPTITVYSAHWCQSCRQLKSYLDSLGLQYATKDISDNPTYAAEAASLSGSTFIPVIQVDDTVISTFNKVALDTALGMSGPLPTRHRRIYQAPHP